MNSFAISQYSQYLMNIKKRRKEKKSERKARIAILTLLIYTNTYVKNSHIFIHIFYPFNVTSKIPLYTKTIHAPRKFSVILTQNNLKNSILRKTIRAP